MVKVMILSLNVCSLNDKIKQKCVAEQMNKLTPDVILLQETHIRKDTKLILNSKKYPTQFHACGFSKARGTSIFIKHDMHFKLKDLFKDVRRFVFVKGVLEEEIVTLASIYAPNSGQINFLQMTFSKFG